ncbi:MAG: ABC transporter ATP-binding protein [Candidatus Hodarchaeales archaeon]|jgi:ABC-type lipoprotein export system ATPase subunit
MSLECKDLIKIYPSQIEGLNFPALRGLDLSVKYGELISIIGPSGAGKTTLLRLISAFDQPSSGEIWFENKLVNQFTPQEILKYRQKVGIMYQSPRDNLLWGLTVLENVLFPMRYSGKFGRQKKERAYELLARVGLKGKEQRKPSQLSGGEQQRVAISVALANDPVLLLADEPTGELDSLTTALIIDYFKKLNEELGVTICVVTHDRRFSKMTNRTYKILDGRVATFEVQATRDKRAEVVIVDSHGNLRLPKEILSQYKDLTSVRIVARDGRIELIPFSPEKGEEKEE